MDAPLNGGFGKPRFLVANHARNYKILGLRIWFFRYFFATIFLDLRAGGGVSGGNCGTIAIKPQLFGDGWRERLSAALRMQFGFSR